MQSSKQGMWKGQPYKWYINLGKLLDRRAEPSYIKLCWVPISPGFSTDQLKNFCSDSKETLITLINLQYQHQRKDWCLSFAFFGQI